MTPTADEILFAQGQIVLVCQRLCREGISPDAVWAALLEQAAYGMANSEAPELMPDVMRLTADMMEAGEYTNATSGEGKPPRSPILTVIEGGGGSKV